MLESRGFISFFILLVYIFWIEKEKAEVLRSALWLIFKILLYMF